jgi:RNA polymerase sigma factor for flagellar operon FliA
VKTKNGEQKALESLWSKYQETKDVESRDELIVQYLFLVKFAVGRVASGLPSHIKLDDLYSSGVTGLIKAVEKFDPVRNNRFESYAVLLIKGAIIDELRELDWIPRSIHQKANLIATAQSTLQQRFGRDPTETELSDYLGLNDGEFEELLLRVRPAILISLDKEMQGNGEEDGGSISEKIADNKASTSYEVADRNEVHGLLEKAISNLPEQERKVLVLYYFEELMLKEIGKILGVSESRVSQIHTKAILKLRGLLKPGLCENPLYH